MPLLLSPTMRHGSRSAIISLEIGLPPGHFEVRRLFRISPHAHVIFRQRIRATREAALPWRGVGGRFADIINYFMQFSPRI